MTQPATTLQFRKAVHQVLLQFGLKARYSYTDKTQGTTFSRYPNRRYVALTVGLCHKTNREAVVVSINARMVALGLSTRAVWKYYHIRGVCVAP